MRLLYESLTFCRLGNEPNISGIEPTRLVLPKKRAVRVVESARVSGIIHGGRGLSLMLNVCKLVRPVRNGEGIESKLLLSRKACWREARLEREGREPERRLRWRERDLR